MKMKMLVSMSGADHSLNVGDPYEASDDADADGQSEAGRLRCAGIAEDWADEAETSADGKTAPRKKS